MTILDDVNDIIDKVSTEENARALDTVWSVEQMKKFDSIYNKKYGLKQLTNIDLFGNTLKEGDWILCVKDTYGGGQKLELKRIVKINNRYISCISPVGYSGDSYNKVLIRPNACIKTSVEQFQKMMQVYESL